MAERKMRYAVLTYFEKYQSVGNKARYQWDADNLLESYSYDEIKDVIDYFFTVSTNKTWTNLVYGFDDYRNALYTREKDAADRRKNRAKLKEWLA